MQRLLTYLCLATIASLLVVATSNAQPGLAARDYQVYSDYLRGKSTDTKMKFLVSGQTIHDRSRGDAKSEIELNCTNMPKDLPSAFWDREVGSAKLSALDFVGVKVRIEAESKPHRPSKGNRDDPREKWEKFWADNPKTFRAIFSFSRVAFDQTGQWALLFVSRFCGPLCGSGDFVVLRKGDDGWREVCEEMGWIM